MTPERPGHRGSQRSSAAERRHWDERYRRRRGEPDREPTEFLLQQAATLPPGRALVLAMGEGRHALHLAALGHDVTGVDISPVAVERCRRAATARGIQLKVVAADLGTYDLGLERFDLITDFFFFDRLLLPTIVAALRPGGRLILETFSTAHPALDSPIGPRDPRHLIDPKRDLEALSALEILHFEELVVGRNDPDAKGPAAVVRLVARRPDSEHAEAGDLVSGEIDIVAGRQPELVLP